MAVTSVHQNSDRFDHYPLSIKYKIQINNHVEIFEILLINKILYQIILNFHNNDNNNNNINKSQPFGTTRYFIIQNKNFWNEIKSWIHSTIKCSLKMSMIMDKGKINHNIISTHK